MILLKVKYHEISHFHYNKNITNILIKVHNKINEFLIPYFLILHILYVM